MRHQSFIARRQESIAERAGEHVAAIVEAAENAAAKMRAAAEEEVASIRENLMADVRAEVQRIRGQAVTDAARIRAEAHAHALRVRERALIDASSEIQAVCGREIQAVCGRVAHQLRASAGAETAEIHRPPIAEVQTAVARLRTAATMLERSLREARAGGDEPVRSQADPLKRVGDLAQNV